MQWKLSWSVVKTNPMMEMQAHINRFDFSFVTDFFFCDENNYISFQPFLWAESSVNKYIAE